MRGHIDPDQRPMMVIGLENEQLMMLVDTGFTGTIGVGLDTARRLGLNTSRTELFSDTAGGRVPYRTSTAMLRWFGRRIPVLVLVWQSGRLGPADGLLGAGMLTGYVLIADFNEGNVEIRDPAQPEPQDGS